MKKLTLTATSNLRLLVYGKPGSGKTYFCGSAAVDPRSTPVLHIDAGGNPQSLLRHKSHGDVLKLEQLDEINEIYSWLLKGQSETAPIVQRLGLTPGYKTVVWDGITDIQDKGFSKAQNTEGYPLGKLTPKREWAHFNGVLGLMINLARGLYDLPLHVIITALEKVDYIEQGAVTYEKAIPLLQGQSVDFFPGYALGVMRMAPLASIDKLLITQQGIKGGFSLGQFQHTRDVYGKDQHGFNMPYVADPTVTKLLDALERA